MLFVENRRFYPTQQCFVGATVGNDPIGIKQRALAPENWNPGAIVWCYLRDPRLTVLI